MKIRVLDRKGREISPCSREKAERLIRSGRASMVGGSPPTIRLCYEVSRPPRSTAAERPGEGRRILVHICCGPCSTYTIERLREEGFQVTGFWYNPNIHFAAEHERRKQCLEEYADEVALPIIIWPQYEMKAFLEMVRGHETYGERCQYCYRMRLTRTAEVAAQQGFDAFTTTLLISPHQNQKLLRDLGGELAEELGVVFHFENLRRGWSERGRLAKEHDLYQQDYCGCMYSLRERDEKARQ